MATKKFVRYIKEKPQKPDVMDSTAKWLKYAGDLKQWNEEEREERRLIKERQDELREREGYSDNSNTR